MAASSFEQQTFYHEALVEAQMGYQEKGIPIGSVLVCDGAVVGRGHNQRMQKHSPILHGEMDALNNAGRLPAEKYQRCTLYTTLSPCAMCTGAILLYKIPRVVIGENKNFMGEEQLLRDRGVDVVVLQDPESIALMAKYIRENPTVWNEDIGVRNDAAKST